MGGTPFSWHASPRPIHVAWVLVRIFIVQVPGFFYCLLFSSSSTRPCLSIATLPVSMCVDIMCGRSGLRRRALIDYSRFRVSCICTSEYIRSSRHTHTCALGLFFPAPSLDLIACMSLLPLKIRAGGLFTHHPSFRPS